ncbi:alanine--glyoxylate aminotransferase family protein [Candidatus Micrarchaeota archaeon]|nr:alanine--glyoxylate aminotransferase family protein [Candidatus Micrarchaeota archaeon]
MMLLSPGPVYIPEEIMKAQTEEMITHRCPEFTELYTNLKDRMKAYLNAEDVHLLTSSGTLGLETLIMNIAKPDEKMVCFSNGVFGDKLGKTAKAYTNTEIHSLDAGKGWNLERAKEHIDNCGAQVFGMVYNETGYGVRNHAKEITQYAKKKGMFTILDCISAWPGTEMDMKEFGLDGFVTGSQKGPACPPGLAILGLSGEAVERIESRDKIPGFYNDLRAYKKRFEKDGQTPFTPAITIMRALRKSFDMMDERGGVPSAVQKHKELSEYVRKRIVELGFELIPEPGFESYTVTAFKGGDNAKEIKKRMKEEFGIVIVGCKGIYSENGLRISNMGYVTKEMLDKCFDALEKIKG